MILTPFGWRTKALATSSIFTSIKKMQQCYITYFAANPSTAKMTKNGGVILEAQQADFAINLLREVSSKGQSTTIVSPISVAIALSMVYAGAKDETAREMNKMLANGAPDSKVHQYFGKLLAAIRSGQKKKYTLEVANKVYVKNGFPILDAFKTAIDRHYRGLFESVDFGQKQQTAKKINEFVEQATHDKIQNLVQPDMLTPLTRLILINAFYFKGSWADKFNANRTQKKTFYASPNEEKQLDMMHKTAKFIYRDAQNYQVLGMHYVGDEVFMFIVLPKKRFGLGQVLVNLSGKELLDLIQMRRKEEVDVVLPKFKLESTHDLNNPLINLGIGHAFGPGAQFGGITEAAPLQIDQVIQKAFIEVNEEGTEAAAATMVGVMLASAHMNPQFIAEHPFAFFLVTKNNENGATILFNGIFAG